MNDSLFAIINEVVARYKKRKEYYASNETATRLQLIDPILNVLGWHLSNDDIVLPNQKNESGGIPDYMLWKNNEKVLVVEAKKVSVSLRNNKVLDQLAKYAYDDGIKFGVLTNGVQWLLFDTFQHNPTDRILWLVDLANSQDEWVTEVNHLLSISYENIEMLEKSKNRLKLNQFWGTHLAEKQDLVTYLGCCIKEFKPKLNIDIREIEDFVQEKLFATLNAEQTTSTDIQPSNNTPLQLSLPKRMNTKAHQSTIKVTFPDGTVVHHNTALLAFVGVIELIGPEKIIPLGLIQNRVPLVSLQQIGDAKYHILNNKYYIMTNSSTGDKIKHLSTISQELNLGLTIEKVLRVYQNQNL